MPNRFRSSQFPHLLTCFLWMCLSFLGLASHKEAFAQTNTAPQVIATPIAIAEEAPGQTKTITVTYRDAQGNGTIKSCWLGINTQASWSYAIWALYDAQTNKVLLRSTDATSWSQEVTPGPGTTTVLSNDMGSINCGATLVNRSGNDITIQWKVTSASAFGGANNIYAYAEDVGNLNSGPSGTSGVFTSIGTWAITNQTPSVVTPPAVTVSATTQLPQTVTTSIYDDNGWANVRYVTMLINDVGNWTNGLYAVCDTYANTIILRSDDGSSWLPTATVGGATNLSNSAGTIDCSQTTITRSGNYLRVNWRVTMKSASLGANNIYAYGTDRGGKNTGTGITAMGTWNISLASPTGLVATAGDREVGLTWDSVEGATKYQVFASTTSGSYNYSSPIHDGPSTSTTYSGLNNGTTYYFVVRAYHPQSTSASSSQVSAKPIPTVFIQGQSVTEGNSGTKTLNFPITIGNPSNQSITISYTTQAGTATATEDFVPVTSNITIPANQGTSNIAVSIKGDTLYEDDETFNLVITSITGARVHPLSNLVGTITNDDAMPSLSIANVSITEGDSGTTPLTFIPTLSTPSGKDTTFVYQTVESTATDPEDFLAATGTFTIPARQTTAPSPISIAIVGDAFNEGTETFVLQTSNIVGASGPASATGTIYDNDPLPRLSVSDVSLEEGNSGTKAFVFTVSLSEISGRPVSFTYQTENVPGGATAANPNADYMYVNSSATIYRGSPSTTVSVLVNGDGMPEPDETFKLVLTGSAQAIAGTTHQFGVFNGYYGTGTILNDDGPLIPPTPTPIPDPNPPGSQTPTYKTFRHGDIFVGLDQNRIEWRRPTPYNTASLIRTMWANGGAGGDSANTYGMSFNDQGQLLAAHGPAKFSNANNNDHQYVTLHSVNGVQASGGMTFSTDPYSVSSFSANRLTNGDITDFGASMYYGTSGAVAKGFDYLNVPAPSPWIAFDNGGRYLYYSSQDGNAHIIRRYKMSPLTALQSFVLPTGYEAHAVAILKNGGAIVAAEAQILQFSPVGTIVGVYDAPGVNDWYSLTLKESPLESVPGAYQGTSFYAAGRGKNQVYSFDVAYPPPASNSSENPIMGTLAFEANGAIYGLAVKNSQTNKVDEQPRVMIITRDLVVNEKYYFDGTEFYSSSVPTEDVVTKTNWDGSQTKYIFNVHAANRNLRLDAYSYYPGGTFIGSSSANSYVPGALQTADSFQVVLSLNSADATPTTVKLDSVVLYDVYGNPYPAGTTGPTITPAVQTAGNPPRAYTISSYYVPGGTLVFKGSRSNGEKVLWSVSFAVTYPNLQTTLEFQSPTNNSTQTDLSNIVVKETTTGNQGFVGVDGPPILRTNTPYISIRNSDGLYWSPRDGAWLFEENYLPTVLTTTPSYWSAYPDVRTYALVQHEQPFSITPGVYRINAYDRTPNGQITAYNMPFQNLYATALVTITAPASAPQSSPAKRKSALSAPGS